MGLGVTPSSWTICNAQGGSAADRILPVCAEIWWPDLSTGTWLNSSLLRASACRAGQCPRAFSTLCSSWEATEAAMAVTKRCNPPFCLDFSEAVIAEVYTKKYFTVCREVGIIKPAVNHVLPVLKATAWDSHWPPSSIPNFPLYLNNSPSPPNPCCSHKETTCHYTASARQPDSVSLNFSLQQRKRCQF